MITKKELIDKTELSKQLHNCGLVRTIANLLHYQQSDSDHSLLIEALITILNAPDAPPIDLYIEEAFTELGKPQFFLTQRTLWKLIPFLNVDMDILLGFITHLVDIGGKDSPFIGLSWAFGKWTQGNSERLSKFYQTVRNGNDMALRQLYYVLMTNTDIEESLIFMQADEKETKHQALIALGNMELGEHYEHVLNALLHGTSNSDEAIAIQFLYAGYCAATRRKTFVPVEFEEQLERILQFGSSTVIDMAVKLLSSHQEILSNRTLDLCLSIISNIDLNKYSDIIVNIDLAASTLVKNRHIIKLKQLLGQLFDNSKGQITFEMFPITYSSIQDAGLEVLGDIVVYWLLNQNSYTHKTVADKICRVGENSSSFSILKSSLPEDPLKQLFLCRKAIGWFFNDPLTAVTIPLAVLCNGSPEITNEVLNLIYNPLLLSYKNTLTKYFTLCITDDREKYSILLKLIKRSTEFTDQLNGIEYLTELHPSESKREIDRIQKDELYNIEQQYQKSPLEEIFGTQCILYGRSILIPSNVSEYSKNFIERELGYFSISAELPLLGIIDPISLSIQLYNFKSEVWE